MLSAVAFTHLLLREVLRPGDTVIDATAGNGHDTLFLAELVGPGGTVLAFDVQKSALLATRGLLEAADISPDRFRLIQDTHANLAAHVPPGAEGQVAAVLFNFGYLPGGDKTVVTGAESSLAAARAALETVKPGGLVLLALYTGHPGGEEEARGIREFAAGLSSREYQAAEYRPVNTLRSPPAVLTIFKARAAS